MSRPLHLVFALGVVLTVGTSLVTGTGAFSSAVADRGLQITTAPDDEACLGFESTTTADNGTANLTVTVTNRVPSRPTLAVQLSVDGETVTVADALGPGEQTARSLTGVPCGATMQVKASGPDVEISFARPVDCS